MKKRLVALACAMACGVPGMAGAQSSQDMKQQIEMLQRQIDALKAQVDNMSKAQAAPAAAPSSGGSFLERKPGDGVHFLTRGGEIQVYGNLDLSLDTATKGLSGMSLPDGSTPPGNGGWMADISSNSSFVGLRGFQALGSFPARFVWQLETQIDVSSNSGSADTNSNQSNVVKGALTSRNSYVGLASPAWGAVKIGKSDAPYKNSTGRMNPFSGMWGDYQVIMGNSGGDNRVEFGTRLTHSIWYESPKWGGFSFAALWSPGQNRANDSSNIPSGEGDCAGGNIPGSGGGPAACNDGSFGSVFSVSGAYAMPNLYLTAAYERHSKVNRTGDLPTFDPNDVADESAAKIGGQYRFAATGTTINAIYERLRRGVPDYLSYQNERQRNGTWLAISQAVGPQDSLHFGWAHAGRTPGDPGTHNTDGGANPDNSSNMLTVAWKHQVDKNFQWYVDYATTRNHKDAHYDLGAGGRSVTTDCHDASNPDTSGFDPNGGAPHCWAGGKLQGASVGMKYTF
ncbi:MAG TPA: porin [Ramlibacter sp.]